MKNISKILCLTLLMVCMAFTSLHAEKVKGGHRPSTPKAESATCLPASSSNELSVNNVRAYIETGGTMWFKELAEYEVPAGSGKTSMFASALWIGGYDANDVLKLAAVRFRQDGNDYWTGPLKMTGASTTQSMCLKFDKHFKITRAEVDQHISAYNTSGYVMPSSIANWPAHGDEGYSYYLAPFKDVNGNEVYDPENGDYPYYDISNELCPWTEDNIARAAAHQLPRTPEDLWTERQNYAASGEGDYQPDWRRSNGMVYADHVLKGDATLFWIFNDNAGAHTESQGVPIGLEIRAQCFGFATNDELNNMTFYSYEIINRSTYTLTQTYFSQWVDPDLGYAYDDYVGCDVNRGLGYCYNGTNVDGSGQTWAYGDQPPAVGVDFFQGPYMDADNRDNPRFNVDSASFLGYCDKFLKSDYELDQMAINGVNFGDSIIDNERFGMRRFVYYNNNSDKVSGEPDNAQDYYNYLIGKWKDNTKMQFGGNAVHTGGPECDFMFPGTSDICNWGTHGTPNGYNKPGGWTEANEGNAPMDRRFMQSAGPFTLKPGSVNYITVGIPWARAAQGGALASVELLKIADDKCQALFENCFKTLDGPDAPDVTIRELENELVILLSNENPNSNNYHETYVELDPQITKTLPVVEYVNDTITGIYDADHNPDTIIRQIPSIREDTLTQEQREYRFEGYQIYQVANASVSATDIGDLNKARLIAQCDIENEASQLVNWIYNDAVGASVATEMVNGSNQGIFHSLRVTEDQFATGSNKKLVNHKEYYFLVIAYGYNQYKEFRMDADYLDGQKTPYLAGRRNIWTYTGIPHKNVENLTNSKYGDQPMITRIEGHGNGGFFLELTDESRDKILENNVYNDVQYKVNGGPLGIKVIDPLQLKPYDFTIKFLANNVSDDVNDSTKWELIISDEVTDEELEELGITREFVSLDPISLTSEQLFPELGISISIKNYDFKFYQNEVDDYLMSALGGHNYVNKMWYGQVDLLGSKISYDGDVEWLSGVADEEGDYPANWIHAGQQASGKWEDGNGQTGAEADYMVWRTEDMCCIITLPAGVNQYGAPTTERVRAFKDPLQQFENAVNGTWAPYVLSSPYDGGPQAKFVCPDETSQKSEPYNAYSYFKFIDLSSGDACPGYNQTLANLYSVDIVLTPDKSKWTRCVVLEAGSGKANEKFVVHQKFNGQIYDNIRHEPKKCPSVGKDGKPDNSGTTGMGWFPGYAINVETGERLNIMFAENSNDTLNNGNDMIFNPTSVYSYAKDMLAPGRPLLLDKDGEPITLSVSSYDALRDSYGIEYGEPLNGGRHYVYIVNSAGNTASTFYSSVSNHNREFKRNYNDGGIMTPTSSLTHGGTFTGNDGLSYPYYDCGAYDEGRWLRAKFDQIENRSSNLRDVARKMLKMQLFSNVMWTSIPMPTYMQEDSWLSSDATIKLRVSRPYYRYSSRWYDDPAQSPNAAQNQGYPMYEFTTKNLVPTKVTNSEETVQNLLDEINIVPNPYYGFSQYEQNALQNYVRIVNLPANCTISIYTVNGTLIRTLTKGDAGTSYVQWDLKNHANIPIAGGVYIIHVKAPGIGERTLKFFCAMRPTDLNGF